MNDCSGRVSKVRCEVRRAPSSYDLLQPHRTNGEPMNDPDFPPVVIDLSALQVHFHLLAGEQTVFAGRRCTLCEWEETTGFMVIGGEEAA